MESIDKGGNFIGWLHCDNNNVSVSLVEEGFAAAYVIQDKGNYGRFLQAAEDSAKRRKIKRWENFVEKQAEENDEEAENKKEEAGERKVNFEKVVVTEVTPEGRVFVQHVDQGPKLEQLMKEIRAEFSTNPPLAGAYTPKRNDLCAAKFDLDGQWYRAKVEKVTPSDVTVLYVDYGNRATIAKAKTASLPSSFNTMQPFAKEFSLALCQLAEDEDYNAQGLQAMREDLLDRPLNMNVEYRNLGVAYVSLHDPEGPKDQTDLIKNLIADGMLLVDRKGGRRMAKLVSSYEEAMDKAKKAHLNIWEYGDITQDDAKEFGVIKR